MLSKTTQQIVFITLYDTGAMGVRLLSSLAEEKGFEPHIIFFKEGKEEKPILYGKKGKDYSFFDDGILHGSTSMAEGVSSEEIHLLLDLIRQIDPRLLCLSTRSFGLELSQKLINMIREQHPDLLVIAGGWGPTTEPENFLDFADYVCLGEGEKMFCDLLDCLASDSPFVSVNNLAFFENNTLKVNQLYPPLTSAEMDALPFPDYSARNKYFITKDQIIPGEKFDQISGYVCMASRGCPMSCNYCQSGQYKLLYSGMGYNCPKIRTRSVENVIAELSHAKKMGSHTIIMRDEVFPFQKKWVDKFIELYKEKINLPFFAYIRPEFHNEKVITRLREAGLYLTRIGIQSGSDFVLKELYNRHLKKKTAIAFASLMEKLGIQYSYHLLCHNPLEKEEHLDETFEFCCQLPPKSMRVFRLVVLPKSRLENLIAKTSQTPLPMGIYDWYSFLFCMATKKGFRRLAIFLHKTHFLKRFPYPLQILYLPSYLRKHFS